MASRNLNWTGKGGSTLFEDANNWQDATNGLNPAATAPTADDAASFGAVLATVTGTGTVATLNFSGFSPIVLSATTLTALGRANAPFLPSAVFSNAATLTFNGGTIDASGGVANFSASGGTATASGGAHVSAAATYIGANQTLIATGTNTAWHNIANAAITGQGSPVGYTAFIGGGGQLQINDGAVWTDDLNAQIGTNTNSGGTVFVNSGAIWNVGTGGISAGANGSSGLIGVVGGTVADAGQLALGANANGTGRLTLNNGTVSVAGNTLVGNNSSGTMSIGTNGTFVAAGTFDAVGNNAGSAGALYITAGGTFQATAAQQFTNYTMVIANNARNAATPGAEGEVSVSGADALLDMGGNPLAIALNGGSGSLSITQGGTVLAGVIDSQQATSTSGFAVGRGGQAWVTLSDTGSNMTVAGGAYFGRGGTAVLVVQNAATFTVTKDSKGAGGSIGIGSGNTGSTNFIGGTGDAIVTSGGVVSSAASINVGGFGADGSLNVTNTGTVLATTTFNIGNAALIGGTFYGGTGSLKIGPGGVVKVTQASQTAVSGMNIGGSNAGVTGLSNGNVTVSGAGALLDLNDNPLNIASLGNGTLSISKGGVVKAGTADSTLSSAIAVGRLGNGEVTVSDLGSQLIADGFVYIGRGGTGTLRVENQGTMIVGVDAKGAGNISIGAANGLGPVWTTGGVGQAFVTTGGGLSTQEDLNVAIAADGLLSINQGGLVEVDGTLRVGNTRAIAVGDTIVSLSGTTVVAAATSLAGNGVVNIGAGSGLKVHGGTITTAGTSDISIAAGGGSTGAINVSGLLVSDQRIGVGAAGVGSLTVSNGGTVQAATAFAGDGAIFMGGSIGGTGFLTVKDAGSVLVAKGQVNVGQAGVGHLLVRNQGTITSGGSTVDATEGFVVGHSASALGDAVVGGANSLLSNTGRFIVGDAARGELTISSGGTVITTPGTAVTNGAEIASQKTADGSTVRVAGAGSNWQVGGGLIVGNAGDGSLNITAGGTVSATTLDDGDQAGGRGHVAVDGAGSILTLTGAATIGDAGDAAMTIFNGGSVVADSLAVGAQIGGAGNIDLEGFGSHLKLTGDLNIGTAGNGVVTIGAGTTLTLGGTIHIGAGGSLINHGGTIDPPALIVDAGGSTGGFGTFEYGTITNNGTLFTTPGQTTIMNVDTITSGPSGSGVISVGDGSTLVLNTGTVDANQTIKFAGGGGTLAINNVAGFAPAVIDNFGTDDRIVVYNQPTVAVAYDPTTQVMTLSDSNNNVLAAVNVSGAGATPNIAANVQSSAGPAPQTLLTINNTGRLGGTGVLDGAIINTGTVYAQDGQYEVTGAITGSGTLEIDPSGYLKLDDSVSGQTINFTGIGATLSIGNATGVAPVVATVNGFQTGDMIVLPNAQQIKQSFDVATQTLKVTDIFGDTVATLTFAGTHTAADFQNAVTNATAAQLSVIPLAADKAEGNTGTTAYTFTVVRAGDNSAAQSVTWAVTGSGAQPADATDFVGAALPTGSVSFLAGETTKTVTINVAGDTTGETDETFAVTLSAPTAGATINAGVATGTIRDDDSGADLKGTVYSWKSHALMAKADVLALGSGHPGGQGTAPMEFRAVHQVASGDVVAELWGNAGFGATSVNTTLSFPTDLTATFKASAALPADWTVTPVSSSGGLSISGSGTTSLVNYQQLGTITFSGAPASNRFDIKIDGGTIGATTITPLALAVAQTTTAADGTYTLSALPKDTYSVIVDRSNSDSTRAITSADALTALRMAAGLNPNPTPSGGVQPLLSPYQFIAADVTGDGKVTSADALAILRMAAKVPTAKVAVFQMVPEQSTFWNAATQSFTVTRTSVPTTFPLVTDLQANTTKDLVAVLTGDVNGSYVPLDGSGNPLATFPKEPDSFFTDLSKANANVPIDLWGVAPNPVVGGTGDDTLLSTAGRDLMTGGLGADIFRFLAATDTVPGANRDAIKDFSSAQGDQIDLTAIDANDLVPGVQAFNFVGTAAFSGARGEVRYDVVGSDTIVRGTIGGTGSDFEIKLIGVTTLAASDFRP